MSLINILLCFVCSAHADAKGIMQLVRQCEPKNVLLVHGEAGKMEFLKNKITQEFGKFMVIVVAQGCESSSFQVICSFVAKIYAFSFIFSPYLVFLPQFYTVFHPFLVLFLFCL